MESPESHPTNRASRRWLVLSTLCALSIIAGSFARAYRLDYPNKPIFDEAYYPEMANAYIGGRGIFDAHPPFGKLLIAAGMVTLGNNVLGWRVVPLIFGLGNVAVMACVWWTICRDKVGTAIISMLVAIDGMFIVYSRIALLDGILFFFIFLALLIALRLWSAPSSSQPITLMGLLTTVLGLAATIKWTGLGAVGPVFYLSACRNRWKRLTVGMLWAGAVYFGVITFGFVLAGAKRPLMRVLRWHLMASQFHLGLTSPHPYSSPWWSWPMLRTPLLLLNDHNLDGTAHVISTRGNTLVWLTSSVMVLVSFAKVLDLWVREGKRTARDHPLTLFLTGYATCYLPLALIHRPLFIYQYMPAYGFALLMLTYWLTELWRVAWLEATIYLVVALAVSAYCAPYAVGWISVPETWMAT